MTGAAKEEPAKLLVDTHTLLWMVENHPRLGAGAGKALNQAAREDRVVVSAITPWEIGVLVSKKRIDLHKDALLWIRDALTLPGVQFAPLEPEIAVASTRLPFDMHADPADRILVATARHLGAVLVTADGLLLELAKKRHFAALNAEK
jgi:PIN domain nuclease of toxin-antitoxin system